MSSQYRRGDIILVQFPFTDLSSSKLRPALVISQHEDDLIILGIFSRIPDRIKDAWVMIDEKSCNFALTGPKKTSIIKSEKITVVHHSIAKQKLGIFPQTLMRQLSKSLKKALKLE